jgi:hypothetical protein
MIRSLTSSSVLLAAMIASSALLGAPAQAAERCETARECHGALPQICMRCGNGEFACAHWACVRHTCEVQMCGGRLTRY